MVDGIVAIVGNSIVLHSDVIQQSQILAASQGVDPTKNPYLFETLYSKTLSNIIDQYAVLDIAEKDTNIVISNDEVDRALMQRIDEFIAQAGSIELFEEAVGMSLHKIKLDYWNEIRNLMLIERYKFSKINNVYISRTEVNEFYQIYKDSIPPTPENYTFSIIEVPFIAGTEAENKIYRFLDSLRTLIITHDVSFDSLAINYSQDPGSSTSGGVLGYTHRGTLVKEYEKAAYALNPGEISPPIRSSFGYHLIKLLDKQGEKISSQHILIFVSFSEEDKENSLKKIINLSELTRNDPFIFDSISIEYAKIYKNFSGTYSQVLPSEIPDFLIDRINNQTTFNNSLPIPTTDGYSIICLYEHKKTFKPNLNNSWNLIYQYALQKKQNMKFQSLIEKIKKNTYIKLNL